MGGPTVRTKWKFSVKSTPNVMGAESYRDLHQTVLATIASSTAHAADFIEIGNLRKAAPEISQAIDQNPKLFNNDRVLEIAGVQPYEWDATLNGFCYPAARISAPGGQVYRGFIIGPYSCTETPRTQHVDLS